VVEHVQKALGDFTLEDLRREKPFPGTFSDRRPWLPARPMPALRQLWQRAIRARDASLQSYLDYTTRRTPTAIEDARREGLITPGQDPWVCVGESLAMVRTRRLSEIIDDERPQFCVPNPMAAQSGLTKDGRLSERCLGNACREDQRFFYVVEFDRCESLDEQARRLWFLSTIRPLVMVLHSGGKSLHGWFWVYGTGDFPRDGFFRMAETLGADPASRSPIQLCRTPWGIRSPKPGEDAPPKPQRVHYFNPEVIRAEVLP
jgi:hypothetical protein